MLEGKMPLWHRRRIAVSRNKPIKFKINSNGCHECVSHYASCGYPLIQRNKIKIQISRYLWKENYGRIPKGMCILHKCDNSKCINLKHLFLGTHYDNMQDKVLKGRQISGFRCWNCKLSDNDIKNIQKSKETYKALGKKYGIGLNYAGRIKCGYKHALK